MSKIFKSDSGKRTSKLPDERREEKTKAGVLVCPDCNNVFYKKKWQSSREVDLKGIKTHEKQCFACQMISQNLYEGEVIVENIPEKYEEELFNLISSFGKEAEKRDSQDRIIKVEKEKGRFKITTTENQLAVRIAKHIHNAFKKTELNISHSKEPHQVSRVSVKF